MRTRSFIVVGLTLLATARAHAAVEVSTATGRSILFDSNSGVAVIEGNAVVDNSTATLKADKISINTKTKFGHAEGNVKLEQSSATLNGTEADYFWETSTGTIKGASGVNPPFRFTADRMTQLSPDLFKIEGGEFTTCDEVPPHYHIKAKSGIMRRGKRVTLKNAELVPDDTPSFWSPIYSKSLVPKKYRLQIEPGHTARDGFTAKTILGYPFSPNTWTNFKWDYLQNTGNGVGLQHIYTLPNIKGNFDSYYIRDYNPDPEIPQSKRYTVLWGHYQRFTPRLTANAKIDIKSDQTFGNQFTGNGNQVLVENQTRGLISDGGLTYQFPKATLQLQASRQDKFDSLVSSKQYISHLTLPSLSFNTVPLRSKRFPFYTSFNGTYVNETQDRNDPMKNLYYKRTVTGGVEMKKDFRVKRRWTFTPVFNVNESFANRVLGSSYVVTEQDQYVLRYTGGLDVRRKFLRWLDLRLGYRYSARSEVNQWKQDLKADDQGVETNQMTGSFQTRIGRSSLVTLGSGYDYRNDPDSQPGKYKHVSARVLNPTLDVQYELQKDVNLYFRETYSIYDTAAQRVVSTPINTSGEIQFGDPSGFTLFTQGFTFSKTASGTPSEVFLNNKLKFYLTPKWYLDIFISYRAVGDGGLNYSKLFPIEKTLRVVRDMHCWVVRGEFSARPGATEVSVYVDLKANLRPTRNVFEKDHSSVYSTRNDGPDVGQLFPATAPAPTPTPTPVPAADPAPNAPK